MAWAANKFITATPLIGREIMIAWDKIRSASAAGHSELEGRRPPVGERLIDQQTRLCAEARNYSPRTASPLGRGARLRQRPGIARHLPITKGVSAEPDDSWRGVDFAASERTRRNVGKGLDEQVVNHAIDRTNDCRTCSATLRQHGCSIRFGLVRGLSEALSPSRDRLR